MPSDQGHRMKPKVKTKVGKLLQTEPNNEERVIPQTPFDYNRILMINCSLESQRMLCTDGVTSAEPNTQRNTRPS